MTEPTRAGRPLALVTGASAGLGAAFARAYARAGHDLVLVARRADRLEALAGELRRSGSQAHVLVSDLSLFGACDAVLETLAGRALAPDVLVNNAGFGIPQDFDAVSWDRQRDFLMTLVVNACGLAHGLVPAMRARRTGAVINVASLAGFAPGVAGNTLYPAAKSFMIKFSQSLDAEVRADGVRVTAICPGFTRTEFAEVAGFQSVVDASPRLFSQSAEAVVDHALRANARGVVVSVPGLHNQVAAFLMQALPQPLVRSLLARGSKPYRL